MLLTAISFDGGDTAERCRSYSGSIVAGRTGNCYRSTSTSQSVHIPFPPRDEVYVGWAWNPDAALTDFDNGGAMALLTNGGAAEAVGLGVHTDGHLMLWRDKAFFGGSTVLAQSGPGVVVAAQWTYMEMWLKVADSGGRVVVRANGVTVIDYTGDTKAGAAADSTVDTLRFAGLRGPTSPVNYDDVYICDTAGAVNNTFLGDIQVSWLPITGQGDHSGWVGSDGNSTDNYALVNEATPAVATYLEATTPGTRDSWVLTDLAGTPTVHGVVGVVHAVRTASGGKTVRQVARVAGVDAAAAAATLTPGYRTHIAAWDTKPGGGAWAAADVNALQLGVEIP